MPWIKIYQLPRETNGKSVASQRQANDCFAVIFFNFRVGMCNTTLNVDLEGLGENKTHCIAWGQSMALKRHYSMHQCSSLSYI